MWEVGQKVIVHNRWHGDSISTVSRITPAGFAVVNNLLYYENGNQRGGDIYSSNYIRVATPEMIEQVRQRKFTSVVLTNMHNCSSITYEQALEIDKILKGDAK